MKRDSLATVLTLRERDEEAAQLVLRDSLLRLQYAELDLQARRTALRTEQEWSSTLLANPFTAGDHQVAALRVESVAQSTIAAAGHVDVAKGAVEVARSLLAAAQQRREVTERLRDRHRASVRQAEERRDGIRVADVVTVQHALRTVEAGSR